jgi:hypothetical protein
MKEVLRRIFIAFKNPSSFAGFKPANLGTNGKHANNYITETPINNWACEIKGFKGGEDNYVVLVVTPCRFVRRYQRFGETYCLNLQDCRSTRCQNPQEQQRIYVCFCVMHPYFRNCTSKYARTAVFQIRTYSQFVIMLPFHSTLYNILNMTNSK